MSDGDRVPFLCRIGLHGLWWSDTTLLKSMPSKFVSAQRCGRCFKWRDPLMGEQVENERREWEAQ